MKVKVYVEYEDHLDDDEDILIDYTTEPPGQYIGNVALIGILQTAVSILAGAREE